MFEEFTERLNKIELSLNNALPFQINQIWQENSFGKNTSSLETPYIQKLIEPNRDLISLGGKRWRPLLMVLLAEQFRQTHKETALSDQQTYELIPLVEFVHTASLIHDDIEDSSDTRRGKPAAYISYGLDTALNAGAWLYFEAPACINTSNIADSLKLTFYKLYTEELRKLHLGQAMDIYWHRNPDIFPDIEEYSKMVRNKTGTLSRLAAELGALCGGLSIEDALETGKTAASIGMGFQIIDDIINLTTGNPGKKRGDDIVEGKKSMPVLLHVMKKPEDKEKIGALMKQASAEGINSPAVEKCITLLNTTDCIKESAEKGKLLIQDNCRKLGFKTITDLFYAMIPEQFK